MPEQLGEGKLRKMITRHEDTVAYEMPLGDARVAVNSLLGRSLALEYTGTISCINCDRVTSKSFNQGYCYPCFTRLAACDSCIMSPEKCHYHEGTCREPEWGEANCMIDHVVYLANTSSLKVGITRISQVPTRWMDQGATHALPIFRVQTRQQSGFVEVLFKDHVSDRTSWQANLEATFRWQRSATACSNLPPPGSRNCSSVSACRPSPAWKTTGSTSFTIR